jgi:uncharacterized membrane protein
MTEQRISLIRAVTAAALVTAAVGIGVQILSGADYPPVPPGAVILVVAAGVCVLWRRWWAPVIAAVVALFLLVGAVVTPNVADQLDQPAGSGLFLGTVVQLAGVVAALVGAIVATTQERRARIVS